MRKYLQVGERLKKLRGDLSQGEFAKKIGVSYKGYQRYESGERIPRPHVLFEIAEKESVTVDWLLSGKVRSLEEKILAKEIGAPFSQQRVSRSEMQIVDRLRKKGLPISSDIADFIDSQIYRAAMVLFSESADIYDFVNIVFYLKNAGKFQEFSKVVEQIGRIFFEGNSTKLEAVRSFLRVLDPGEKKQDPDGRLGQKAE